MNFTPAMRHHQDNQRTPTPDKLLNAGYRPWVANSLGIQVTAFGRPAWRDKRVEHPTGTRRH